MKRRIGLSVVLAAGLVATACTGGTGTSNSSNSASNAGTLTIAVGADMTTFDPAANNSASVAQRVAQIVEGLTTIDPNGGLQPLLATAWKPSVNGLSWVFTLRPNVKFSDGEPFDASAVKFSLDRINSAKTLNAKPDALQVIKDVQVVDPLHVKIDLKSPYPALPRAVSLPVGGIVAPKASVEAPNTIESITKPVGTGPYAFKENVKGDHLTLTRNDKYWGKKPAYGTQIWKVVPEAPSRLALLRSGGADVILDPPASNLAELKKDPSVSVSLAKATNAIALYFDEKSKHAPQLANPAVRQALSYAIDRNKIISVLAFGAAAPLRSPIPDWDAGSCDAGNYGYDPSKAKQMLAAAGASNLSINLVAPNGRYLNDYQIGQAVAGYLRAVGVKVNLAPPTDFPTYLSQVYAQNQTQIDAYIMGLGSLFLDGGHAIQDYQTKQVPPTGYNGFYYSNPSFDALMSKIDVENDQAKRRGMICDGLKMLVRDAPGAYLYALKIPVVMRSGLKGLTYNPAGLVNPSWVQPSK